MDSELAAAMEPLNPNQDSIDSLVSESRPYQYSHHTVGPSGYSRVSPPQHYISDKAHPFSTFQPSRQQRVQQPANDRRAKPSHSISAEFIPYLDRRMPPPDLAHVLHQLRAPTQPPQAVVNPVNSHRRPMANSQHHLAYEEPGMLILC